MAEIGATLREARMRARIDVSEIEAQTKIRAKYLRALENEEWDLLPGPTFVKSFLRTYAQALGLDGKALVEQYMLSYERPDESDFQPIVASSQRRQYPRSTARSPTRSPRASRPYTIAVAAFSLLIVLLLVLLVTGKGSKNAQRPTGHANSSGTRRTTATARHTAVPTTSLGLVSLSLHPTGRVYVCLIGDGRKRIPGVILTPESALRTYHARRFDLTLGNNAVTMYVDGKALPVPASSQAIGYSVTSDGRHPLAAGALPTCA